MSSAVPTSELSEEMSFSCVLLFLQTTDGQGVVRVIIEQWNARRSAKDGGHPLLRGSLVNTAGQ